MKIESTAPWWLDYRKQKRKPKSYLNTEMILRKSLSQALKEYTENSSIAGFKELFSPHIHWIQRLVCIFIFVVMFSTMCYILHYTWHDTLAKPLIVTMESSTHPIAKIDFPAVALCNVNRVSKKALKELAEFLYPKLARHNETLEEVEQYLLQSGRLIDGSYNESMKSFLLMKDTSRKLYKTYSIIDMMKRLAPRCDEMLVKCSWAGKIVDCSSIFSIRRTVRGHCCAFNYVLNYDSSGRPNSTSALVKRQVVPGFHHGLSVVLNPMTDDYAYPVHNIKGFDVFIFDPTHFADPSGGHVTHRIVEPNQAKFFDLKSVKQRASAEVRKYPLNTRKCLFHDEIREKFGEMYSYSACLVDCRVNSIQSLCKCTPYYLPSDVHKRVCATEDLRCLNKYKEKQMYIYPINAMEIEGLEQEIQESLYCPNCLPDCELTRHHTKSFKSSLTLKANNVNFGYRYNFLQHINLTDKCFLTIYQSTADGILNRLDVVAYWFEILSNVGGFGGILVGFSIICLTELFYFFCVRFLTITIFNFMNYH